MTQSRIAEKKAIVQQKKNNSYEMLWSEDEEVENVPQTSSSKKEKKKTKTGEWEIYEVCPLSVSPERYFCRKLQLFLGDKISKS